MIYLYKVIMCPIQVDNLFILWSIDFGLAKNYQIAFKDRVQVPYIVIRAWENMLNSDTSSISECNISIVSMDFFKKNAPLIDS
jgi:hypothetical protein